jgi:hypothetical protein
MKLGMVINSRDLQDLLLTKFDSIKIVRNNEGAKLGIFLISGEIHMKTNLEEKINLKFFPPFIILFSELVDLSPISWGQKPQIWGTSQISLKDHSHMMMKSQLAPFKNYL